MSASAMSGRKKFSFSSLSPREKSPTSALSNNDPQPSRTSALLLQAPQTGITASQTVQESNDASTIPPLGGSRTSLRSRLSRWIRRLIRGNTSTTPLGQSRSRLSRPSIHPEESADNPPSTLNVHTIHDDSAGANRRRGLGGVDSLDVAPLSAPVPSVSPTSDNDRKKTIISGTKLLLQTAATALQFAPIPNLDQIPNTLLTWIQIYEVSASL